MLYEVAKVVSAGAWGVTCTICLRSCRYCIISLRLTASASFIIIITTTHHHPPRLTNPSVHPTLHASTLGRGMHELIAFLSGRPVRLSLRPRSPFSPRGWTVQDQRTLHSRPIIMLSATNCEQNCISCPVCRATAPPLQQSHLQMKPYRLQCRSLNMHSQPSEPSTPSLPSPCFPF